MYTIMSCIRRTRSKSDFSLLTLLVLVLIGCSNPGEGTLHEPIQTEHCFSSPGTDLNGAAIRGSQSVYGTTNDGSSGTTRCYQTPGPHVSGSRSDAEGWCNQWGASLPSITSRVVQQEVDSFLGKSDFSVSQTVLTSARRQPSKYWKWVNGDRLDAGTVVSFYDVIRSRSVSNESVVADISVDMKYTSYLTARPVHNKSYYICDYPDPSGCDSRSPRAENYYDSNCYSLHTDSKETWWGARTLCQSYGGDLAVVFDADRKYRIHPTNLTTNETYWVGALHQCWEWQPQNGDAVEMKYSNWDEPSAPLDGSNVTCVCLNGASTTEDGGGIYSSTSSQPWKWLECDCNRHWNIICQRNESYSTTGTVGIKSTTTEIPPATPSDYSNSHAVGLGVGLGIGLFALLLIAAGGLFVFLRKSKTKSSGGHRDSNKQLTGERPQSPPSSQNGYPMVNKSDPETVSPNSRHLPQPPASPVTVSEQIGNHNQGATLKYQDLTGSWRDTEAGPRGYERLQELRSSLPAPPPPPFLASESYYEQLPESPIATNLGEYSDVMDNSIPPVNHVTAGNPNVGEVSDDKNNSTVATTSKNTNNASSSKEPNLDSGVYLPADGYYSIEDMEKPQTESTSTPEGLESRQYLMVVPEIPCEEV